MPGALTILLPLITAGVLVASAITKFRRPDDLTGWGELGVPLALRRPILVRLHPWGELALGVALIVFGGFLGLLAALVAVVLMAGYLWLVWRAFRRAEDASCACFGARTRITVVTVVRNAWLTLLAAATAAVIWMTPLLGGALVEAVGYWSWIAGALVAAMTTALILWPEAAVEIAPVAETHTPAASDHDQLDYIQTRTPAVPVSLADGTIVNLRTLAMARPILLLAVSSTCGSCTPVIERAGEWRSVLPELDIRLLLMHDPAGGTLTETSEPQSLHDPQGYVRGSIADWPTPTALLLGVDGMLGGGPVSGVDAITEFVEDIRASLDEAAAAATSP